MTKTVYLFDADGKFAGTYDAQESPLEPGVYLAPVASTYVAPPPVVAGQFVKWAGESWTVEVVPQEVVPQEDLTAKRVAEIKSQLVALDIKRIRPMAEGDSNFLATLNAQAVALRAELVAL